MHLTNEQEEIAQSVIMKKKNVLGYDAETKKKVKDGKVTNIDSIVIYVRKKVPIDQVAPQDLVDAEIEGMKTDVIEVGAIVAQFTIPTPQQLLLVSRMTRYRPVPMGVSLGATSVTAGSAGVLVKHKTDGRVGIRTNYHVSKNDENVVQPGPIDGGGDLDKVGRSIGISIPVSGGKVDIGVVVLDDIKLARTEILDLGIPKGVNTNPTVGMKLKKSGRTSGLTEGTITSISAVLSIQYNDGIKTLEALILTSKMSDGGDSGSALLDEANNVVGHIFAGSDTYSVGCREDSIQEALPDWEVVTTEINAKYGPTAIKLPLRIEPEQAPPPPAPTTPFLSATLDKSSYFSGDSITISGNIKDVVGLEGKLILARSSAFQMSPTSAVSDKDGNFTIKTFVRVVSVPTDFEIELSFNGDP